MTFHSLRPLPDHCRPQSTSLNLSSHPCEQNEATSNAKWGEKHPTEEVGYTAKLTTVRARDGVDINVKVSSLLNRLQVRRRNLSTNPIRHRCNHTLEESWFLCSLYTRFDLVIISVEYRLAPENRFPTWIEHSEDVLDALFDTPEVFVGLNANIKVDLNQVILAGSSSGAGISAVLSQICRGKGIPVNGIILNVPMLCDPRSFQVATYGSFEESLRLYTQCMDIFKGSNGLLLEPDSSGSRLELEEPSIPVGWGPEKPSTTFGLCCRTGSITGRRDRLEEGNVPVTLHVYKGVPHNFGQYWELKVTKMFWDSMKAILQK
ncbi:hypothetical protein N7451_011709 [Penicillium sp. IBT 35674x]|nr:hypothetical protein N7451_011709 [Penicillium sp. IBT 35674x]